MSSLFGSLPASLGAQASGLGALASLQPAQPAAAAGPAAAWLAEEPGLASGQLLRAEVEPQARGLGVAEHAQRVLDALLAPR
jgi:hypothetical protein